MSLAGAQLEITQAIMAWLASRPAVQALDLVRCELDFSGKPQPRYPANPLTDVPDALAQNHSADNARTAGNGLQAIYLCSIWVRWRQTPGNNAQVELMTPVQVLEAELLSDACPYDVQRAGADQQTPAKISYHDEMPHPLIDEPRLRVSVGEILIQITSNKEQ